MVIRYAAQKNPQSITALYNVAYVFVNSPISDALLQSDELHLKEQQVHEICVLSLSPGLAESHIVY